MAAPIFAQSNNYCISDSNCLNGYTCINSYCTNEYSFSTPATSFGSIFWIFAVFIIVAVIGGLYHHHNKGRGGHGGFVSVGHGGYVEEHHGGGHYRGGHH